MDKNDEDKLPPRRQEGASPTEEEKRRVERELSAQEAADRSAERWEEVAKINRATREEERKRVTRNRQFLKKIGDGVLFVLLFGAVGTLVYYRNEEEGREKLSVEQTDEKDRQKWAAFEKAVDEKRERNRLVDKQKRNAQIASVAATNTTSLDEIASEITENAPSNDFAVMEAISESEVACFGKQYGINDWFVHLDHKSFIFVQLHRDKKLHEILSLWRARKK